MQDVRVGGDLQSIIVQLNDDDLDPTLAINDDNFRVVAANGDADGDGDPCNDGDDCTRVYEDVAVESLGGVWVVSVQPSRRMRRCKEGVDGALLLLLLPCGLGS